MFNARYQTEEKMKTLFGYFSALTIFISCLGLFGLASFAAEQRTREIGIRKALGATSSGLMILMAKDFTRWVLAANIIAWPLIWWFMHNWLESFPYRITMHAGVFLMAGFGALVIALITVSYHSIRAAHANPATSLKYE